MRLIRWLFRRSGPCSRCGAPISLGIRTTTIVNGRLRVTGSFCQKCFVVLCRKAIQDAEEQARQMNAEMVKFLDGVKQAFDVFRDDDPGMNKVVEDFRKALGERKPGNN